MAFKKASEFGGGSYFKPLEHMNDLALLIEPVSIQRDVPNTYNGKTTPRDEVTATITIFANSEAIEKGKPTEIVKGCKVVHGMLTSTLEKMLGEATVTRLEKIATKSGGSGYVFRDVAPAIEASIENYYTQREAAVQQALADVPDFD